MRRPVPSSNKQITKSLLKEQPYFNFRGNLVLAHGQFNNSLHSELPTKRELDKLHSLYDLDLFNVNIAFDTNQIDNDTLMSQCIRSHYFSSHSLRQFSCSLSKDQMESSLSIFHNKITSLNRNLDDLMTHYLHKLGFHFNIIGVTETKIHNSNQNTGLPNIPDYAFEHVPTPLACGGVGPFVDETLNYPVLEKVSTESFQALWIKISFVNQKNVICGIMYR